MPWSWARPTDPSLLEPRPLLDLGVGDGQTLLALTGLRGLVVGLDRAPAALRAAARSGVSRLVLGEAASLPFPDATFAVVLAGDLFHHLDGRALQEVLVEARRVLRPGGTLVAWWYRAPGRSGPDAPPHPRPRWTVARAALRAGFQRAEPLPLLAAGPAPTTGLCATA